MIHLEAVRRLKQAGIRLRRTVYITFVPGEYILENNKPIMIEIFIWTLFIFYLNYNNIMNKLKTCIISVFLYYFHFYMLYKKL